MCVPYSAKFWWGKTLAIFNFWQGKHWRMLDPVVLAGGKFWQIIRRGVYIAYCKSFTVPQKVSWTDR